MMAAIQNAKRIAFQGEPGAYANLAAKEAVPHAAAIPQPTFEDAVEAVRGGDCDLCIIPVENSLIGRIADIHHLLPDSGLHIVGEHFLPIHHQLLGLKTATLEDVTDVYSQAPALAQVRGILRDRKFRAHNWYDTAGSANHVAALGDVHAAAVASSLATYSSVAALATSPFGSADQKAMSASMLARRSSAGSRTAATIGSDRWSWPTCSIVR